MGRQTSLRERRRRPARLDLATDCALGGGVHGRIVRAGDRRRLLVSRAVLRHRESLRRGEFPARRVGHGRLRPLAAGTVFRFGGARPRNELRARLRGGRLGERGAHLGRLVARRAPDRRGPRHGGTTPSHRGYRRVLRRTARRTRDCDGPRGTASGFLPPVGTSRVLRRDHDRRPDRQRRVAIGGRILRARALGRGGALRPHRPRVVGQPRLKGCSGSTSAQAPARGSQFRFGSRCRSASSRPRRKRCTSPRCPRPRCPGPG